MQRIAPIAARLRAHTAVGCDAARDSHDGDGARPRVSCEYDMEEFRKVFRTCARVEMI
jgi:hypothetical protein